MNAPTDLTTEVPPRVTAGASSDLNDVANRSHEMKLMPESLARTHPASRVERARERHRRARLAAALRAQQRAELEVARGHSRIFLAGR